MDACDNAEARHLIVLETTRERQHTSEEEEEEEKEEVMGGEREARMVPAHMHRSHCTNCSNNEQGVGEREAMVDSDDREASVRERSFQMGKS